MIEGTPLTAEQHAEALREGFASAKRALAMAHPTQEKRRVKMSKQLTSENSTMKERLQVSRWGKIRKRMYEMEVGESVEFPTNTGDNVGSTVCRMNDAFYGERKWTCQRRKRVATVTREK